MIIARAFKRFMAPPAFEGLDAFVHTVAHDLKGPIGLIVGFADMLLEGYTALPNEAIQRALLTMTNSGIKASNIVEALLRWPAFANRICSPNRSRWAMSSTKLCRVWLN
jgi:signal transduction histidine kinase